MVIICLRQCINSSLSASVSRLWQLARNIALTRLVRKVVDLKLAGKVKGVCGGKGTRSATKAARRAPVARFLWLLSVLGAYLACVVSFRLCLLSLLLAFGGGGL